MIIALWQRYVTGSRWWLALIVAVLIADVFLGSWIIAWELKYLKEVFRP